MWRSLALLLVLPAAAFAQYAEVEVQLINKKRATAESFTLKPQTLLIHNNLEIQAIRCSRANEQDAAWVKVTTLGGEELFAGWLYADFPGANGLNHPIYQLNFMRCKR